MIDDDGEQLGVKPIQEAIALAQDKGLDLLEISSQATPPVCRIIDFSKYKYEREKKLKEAKKKNRVTVMKEVRIRPKIGKHDLDIKIKRIKGFIEEKDKVRVSIIFQGREMQHRELGNDILTKLLAEMQEIADVETNSRMMGNRLFVTLLPKK